MNHRTGQHIGYDLKVSISIEVLLILIFTLFSRITFIENLYHYSQERKYLESEGGELPAKALQWFLS